MSSDEEVGWGTILLCFVAAIVVLMLMGLCGYGCQALIDSGRMTNKEFHQNSGLLGRHSLVKTAESYFSQESFIHGRTGMRSGSLDGEGKTVPKIQFFWSPKPGEVVVTSLPYSKFRFIIDETATKPTVEFIFYEGWYESRDHHKGALPGTLINLNPVIESDELEAVVVRSSSTAFASEVLVPKLSQ